MSKDCTPERNLPARPDKEIWSARRQPTDFHPSKTFNETFNDFFKDGETYEIRNRVTLCRCGRSVTPIASQYRLS
jgi:hypothetical protein